MNPANLRCFILSSFTFFLRRRENQSFTLALTIGRGEHLGQNDREM